MSRREPPKTRKQVVGGAFFAAGIPVTRRPPPLTDEEKRARRKPQSAAQRERVAKFLRGEAPVVEGREAAGAPVERRTRFTGSAGNSPVGGLPPLEPVDARVLREIATDLGVGTRKR